MTLDERRALLTTLLNARNSHGFTLDCACIGCFEIRTMPHEARDLARCMARMFRFRIVMSIIWAALGYALCTYWDVVGWNRAVSAVLVASIFWTDAPDDVRRWWYARRFTKAPAAE